MNTIEKAIGRAAGNVSSRASLKDNYALSFFFGVLSTPTPEPELYNGEAPSPVNGGTVTDGSNGFDITGIGPAIGGIFRLLVIDWRTSPSQRLRFTSTVSNIVGAGYLRTYDSSFVVIDSKEITSNSIADVEIEPNAAYLYLGANTAARFSNISVKSIP